MVGSLWFLGIPGALLLSRRVLLHVSRSGDTEKALLHRETPYSPLHVPHPAAPIACRFGSDLTSAAAFEPISIMNQLGPDRVYGTCLRVAHNHPRRKQTRRSDRGQWPEPAWPNPPAPTPCPKPPGPEAALGPNEAERRSSLSELTQAGQRVYAEVGVAFDGELDLRLVNHLGACGA